MDLLKEGERKGTNEKESEKKKRKILNVFKKKNDQ